jgi:hypothetical protein
MYMSAWAGTIESASSKDINKDLRIRPAFGSARGSPPRRKPPAKGSRVALAGGALVSPAIRQVLAGSSSLPKRCKMSQFRNMSLLSSTSRPHDEFTLRGSRLLNTTSFSHSHPTEVRGAADRARAEALKSSVLKVATQLAALDQTDGVDISTSEGSIIINSQQPLDNASLDSLTSNATSGKVLASAIFDKDGQLQNLLASVNGGSSEATAFQYERKWDGSQIYEQSTPGGQTLVRENVDGTLFMLECPEIDSKASEQNWSFMSSSAFMSSVAGSARDPVSNGFKLSPAGLRNR